MELSPGQMPTGIRALLEELNLPPTLGNTQTNKKQTTDCSSCPTDPGFGSLRPSHQEQLANLVYLLIDRVLLYCNPPASAARVSITTPGGLRTKPAPPTWPRLAEYQLLAARAEDKVPTMVPPGCGPDGSLLLTRNVLVSHAHPSSQPGVLKSPKTAWVILSTR